MKTAMIVLSAMCLALMTGCYDESFSRYPSVSVPEYTQMDYVCDLSSSNPVLVYNAICNLGSDAAKYSKALCGKDADPASSEYKNADKVYRAVCDKLNSKNPQIVAVSLRFLQLFAADYKPKAELLASVIRIESSHPLVQFEQISLLKILVDVNSHVPEPLVRRLLNSPSWIVSRSAYGLVGRLNDKPLRQKLVQNYRDTEDEKERLILIQALSHRLQPDEAQMLEQEMFAVKSSKLRDCIGKVLLKNASTPEIRQGLIDHYTQFNDQEKAAFFSESEDAELACQFLKLGYVPDDKCLEKLLEDLFDKEKKDERDGLLRIEQALLASPKSGERWLVLKGEAEQNQQRYIARNKELVPISQEFVEKMRAFQTKNEIPDNEMEGVWKIVAEMIEPVMKENGPEKVPVP